MNKYKVNDTVKHEKYGKGKIVFVDNNATGLPYAVEFEKEHSDLYDLGSFRAPTVKNKHGFWCYENELELVEEALKNFMPEIAKMLGVEIGNLVFVKTENSSDTYAFDEEYGLISQNGTGEYEDAEILIKLLSGKLKFEKLPKIPTPKLTEAERVILENLPKEYKWIARDENNRLWFYTEKPEKEDFLWQAPSFYTQYIQLFNHLFQFIKWDDEEPYNIEELLKGEI